MEGSRSSCIPYCSKTSEKRRACVVNCTDGTFDDCLFRDLIIPRYFRVWMQKDCPYSKAACASQCYRIKTVLSVCRIWQRTGKQVEVKSKTQKNAIRWCLLQA